MKNILVKIFGSRNQRVLKDFNKILKDVNSFEQEFKTLGDLNFPDKTKELRSKINDSNIENYIPEAFALVREASRRVLKMRHFDEQILGGLALFFGNIAEMKTGEGKTLVATLPAYLYAAANKNVHIVTVNDYLAKRDSEWMGKIFSFLGVSSDAILSKMSHTDKKNAYSSDIVYGTNNEFGFDYLRDNMVSEISEKVQGNLDFAIIDEVDSILIDEARTPLIISGSSNETTDLYYKVEKLVNNYQEGAEEDERSDFYVDEKVKQVYLTEKGHLLSEKLLLSNNLMNNNESLYDPKNINLLHFITTALRARFLYQKNVDYIVENSSIVIIDEFTGRKMPGRRWGDGLHQAIEAKEKLKIEKENKTYANITFQNFFRMYEKISGMTGTADTEAEEFKAIYNLEVISIPTHKNMIREDHGDMIYLTKQEKYDAIVSDIKECNKKNQPVLVGTSSIDSSEYLSKILKKINVEHEVLNAKLHEKESLIIENAGLPGAVTIATNMAGRGTDIALGGKYDESETWKDNNQIVKEAGGLHVIGTERHESRRIDNQLRGRSGRQGDPGSSRFYLSLEDNLMRIFASEKVSSLMQKFGMKENEAIEHPWVTKAISNAQKKVETHNFDIRKHLIEYDDVMNDQRKFVYEKRDHILDQSFSEKNIEDIVINVNEDIFYSFFQNNQLDIDGYEDFIKQNFNISHDIKKLLSNEKNKNDILKITEDLFIKSYQNKKENLDNSVFLKVEREILLSILDYNWIDHLQNMDSLRQGINLRSYAQKNPKQEYKKEGYNLFQEMISEVHSKFLGIIFKIEVNEDSTSSENPFSENITLSHDKPQSLNEPIKTDNKEENNKRMYTSGVSNAKRKKARLKRKKRK